MQAFGRWVQKSFFTLFMLMLAAGFAILLAELLLTNHTDGIQLVAVVAAVAGLIFILAGLFVRGRAATVVAVLLLLLSVTGLIGTFEHLEEGGGEGERASVPRVEAVGNQQVSLRLDDDEENEGAERAGGEQEAREGEEGESEGNPPPLAPLSLAGLSMMGALGIVGAGKREA